MKLARLVIAGLACALGAASTLAEPNYGSGRLTPCVSKKEAKSFAIGPEAGLSEWAAVVAGGFDRKKAMNEFKEMQERHEKLLGDFQPVAVATCDLSLGTKLFYSVRLPAKSREDAAELCGKLRDAGLPCIVGKN